MWEMVTPAIFEDKMKEYLDEMRKACDERDDRSIARIREATVTLMCDALKTIGFEKGIEIYKEMDKKRTDYAELEFYRLP